MLSLAPFASGVRAIPCLGPILEDLLEGTMNGNNSSFFRGHLVVLLG